MFSALSGAITNIVLNFILIPVVGINGAAIATCVSYFVVFVYRIIDTRKYINLNVLRKDHWCIRMALFVMVISEYFDGMICSLILVSEFLFMLFCNRNIAITVMETILKKIHLVK